VAAPPAALVTTTAMIRDHRAEVRAVVDGTLEGIAYVRAHPKETVRLVGQEFKLSPDLARATYAAEVKNYNAVGGRVPVQDIREVLAIGQAFAAKSGSGANSGGAARPVPATLSESDLSKLVDLSLLPSQGSGG
jgi:ABC-type nitrate/sulfonate/bicarbonate transport system substrate-binding protein